MRPLIAAAIVAALCSVAPATAEARDGAVVAWTALGAGAGFGVGMLVGLRAFDDAVNSDRKVWTAAIAGGLVGAATGFAVGLERHRRRAAPARTGTGERRPAPLDAALMRELVRSVRLVTAPARMAAGGTP